MTRALLVLLIAASMTAFAQDPKTKPADPKAAAQQTKAEKKAAKKAEKEAKKAEAKKAAETKAAPAPTAAAKPAPVPAPAPAAKPAPAPAATAKAPAAKTGAVSTAIVANKDSKIYHRADCKLAGKMKDAHKVTFASAAEADKAGYKACKVCKP